MEITYEVVKEYEELIGMDQKVYPTPFPVTLKGMQSWFIHNPHFSFYINYNTQRIGVCVTIPLNSEGWDAMQQGRIREDQVDESHIFEASKHTQIFLHIYHIEKFPDNNSFQIWKLSLVHLKDIVDQLQMVSSSDIMISGVSGYCVTSAGVHLFQNKWNGKELGHISKETLVRDEEGNLKVMEIENDVVGESVYYMGKRYEVVQRAKLLSTRRGDNSLVWEFL